MFSLLLLRFSEPATEVLETPLVADPVVPPVKVLGQGPAVAGRFGPENPEGTTERWPPIHGGNQYGSASETAVR